MKRIWAQWLAVAAVMITAPMALDGQSCMKCEDDDVGGPHRFNGYGAYFQCWNCHSGWQPQLCYNQHIYGCGGPSEEELEDLAASIDAAGLQQVAATIARWEAATVNTKVGSVDFRCGEVVTMRVYLPAGLSAALSRAVTEIRGTTRVQ